MSKTLGTRAGRHSPATCAARPGDWRDSPVGTPSGSVSSGGGGCGAAGSAGSTRTSQPPARLRSRGGGSAAASGRRESEQEQARQDRGAAHQPTTVARCEQPVLPTLPRDADGRGCRVPGGAAGRLRRPADARRARLRAWRDAASCRSRRPSWWPDSCSARAGSRSCSISIRRSGFVQGLAVVALVLILFRDGLEVEQEMLQEAWHLPLAQARRSRCRSRVCSSPCVDPAPHGPELGRVRSSWARCCLRPTRCSRPPWSQTRACRG